MCLLGCKLLKTHLFSLYSESKVSGDLAGEPLMQLARRPLRRAFFPVLFWLVTTGLFAAEKPRITVDSYIIDAEIIPRTHKLVAKAKVKFTALDDISVATFELNNALRPTKVQDVDGKPLSAERV